MDAAASAEPASARRAGLATGTLFLVNGATFSNWLPRIPEIRDHLGLSNGGLGATLLGGGLGGIIGALVVGRIMDRFGSKRVLTFAACCLSIGVVSIGFVGAAPLLLVILTTLGVLDVLNDVAMNTQGVMVQDQLGRSIMNRLHGMWSLGFTGGALVGSLASAAGLGLRLHLTIVGALLLTAVLMARRWFIPVDTPHEPAPVSTERKRRLPSRPMLLMTMAAFAAAVLEVTPNDWAAVVMRDVFDAGRFSGLGTVACAGAMLVGRLGGDHVLDRVGPTRLMNGALVLVGTGTVITVTAPHVVIAFAGLIVWGLGLSVVFPGLYAAAARLPGVSAGSGLGSMLLGQRFGGMCTAVSIGVIADWQGLRAAVTIVCGIAFGLLFIGLRSGRSDQPALTGDGEPAGASAAG